MTYIEIDDLNNKYKTKMCLHYMRSGKCPLKKHCGFAHGKKELRTRYDPLP